MRLIEVTETLEPFVTKITNDCTPFLKQIGYNVIKNTIVRGIPEYTNAFIKKNVRLSDREDVATSKAVHDAINIDFKKKYGRPYRNGAFAAHPNHAVDIGLNYGEIFLFFPIGKFSFLWSPKISDLFIDESDEEQINLAINTKYTTKNLKAAIKSTHEIMFWCSAYYGIRLKDNKIIDIQNAIAGVK